MRIGLTLLLALLCYASFGQPANDECISATTLFVNPPTPCPSSSPAVDIFNYNNNGATPTTPFPTFTGCTGGDTDAPADEVWFNFQATSNQVNIAVNGLNTPNVVLFEQTNDTDPCGFLQAFACGSAAAGAGSIAIDANLQPGQIYFIMVSGGNVGDQGNFQLTVTSIQDCAPCLNQTDFIAGPPPTNGTYSSGQSVNFCYTVNEWDVTGSIEWLHAVEVQFGPGWDLSTLQPFPPPSCGGDGSWNWYNSWTSCNTGITYGPGFAYDSSSGLGCGGAANDGDPGNNWGDGTSGCSNITPAQPFTFCWNVSVGDCPPNITGNSLSLNVNVLSDGDSGSWTQTGCNSGSELDFLASAICCDDFPPLVAATPTTCPGTCDGSLEVTPGGGFGTGPWNVTVFDGTGNIAFAGNALSGTITVPDLCQGNYSVLTVNVLTNCNRSQPATVVDGFPPDAIASNPGPFCPGAPIILNGSTSGFGTNVSYSWTGPFGFTSTAQNPTNATDAGTYTLIVTVDGCVSQPATTEVVVQPASIFITASETTICAGNTVQLNASGALNYDWGIAGTGPTIFVTPFMTTTYTVTGIDANNCTASESITINVNPMPNLTVTQSGPACEGNPIVLIANGALTYEWIGGPMSQSYTVVPSPPNQMYTVIGTDAFGCQAAVDYVVNVNPSPNATATASPQTICAGEPVTLTATGGNTYVWDDPNNSSGQTITVSPSVNTTYNVLVTDFDGCQAAASVDVFVDLPLVPPVVNCGTATTNSVEFTWAAVPGATGYNITVNSGQTGGQLVGTTYTQPNLMPGEAVTITVEALGGGLCGSATTTTTCNAEDCPNVVITIPPVNDICRDAPTGNITLQANITGNTGTGTGIWSGPGIIDATNGIFNPDQAQVGANVITYTYTEGPCPYNADVTITVNDTPTATFTVDNNDICTTDPVQVTYTGSAGPGATYTWNFNGGNATPGTGPGPHSVTFANGGNATISLSVVENGCPSGTESETITISSPIPNPMIQCANTTTSSVEFSWNPVPGANNYTVNVSTGQTGTLAGTNYTVNNLAPGETVTIEVIAESGGPCGNSMAQFSCSADDCPTFTITIDPVADICLDGSASPIDLNATVIGGTGTGTEAWSGTGISNTATGTFNPNTAGAGTHTITYTYTEGTCIGTETIDITVFDQPTADFTVDDTNICEDGQVTVTYAGNADAAATYTWNFAGGTATPGTGQGPHSVEWATPGDKIITLIVEAAGCVSTQFSQTVTVDAPLAEPVIDCNTTTSSIEFTWAAITGATSYNVTVTTGQTGTLSGTSYTVTGLMPGEMVSIEVEAVGTGPCGNSIATTNCSADDCPTVVLDIDPVDDICLDANAMPIDLEATITGGAGNGTELWAGPGITMAGTGLFDPAQAGTGIHTITLTYTEGNCTYTETIQITVNEQPTADFTVVSPICIDESTTITYTGSGAAGATYTWNFNGGTATPGTGQGPHDVNWATAGEKTITLIVTENGCASEVFTQTVQVDAPLEAPVVNCNSSTTEIEFTWADVTGASSYNVTVTSGQTGTQNGNSFTVTGLMPGEDVTIEVEAVGPGACGNSTTTETCTAQDCPMITIAIDPVADICLTNIVVETDLNAVLTGASGTGTETWDGPGIIDQVNGTFDPNVSGAGAHTINYTYTENNCSYNASITINVFDLPTADFTVTSPICLDETSSIIYTGSAAPDATYTWNFNGGTIVSGMDQGPYEIEWPTAGDKTITLVVTENGCASEAFTQTVQVDAPLDAPVINCNTSTTQIEFTWDDVTDATDYNVTVLTGQNGTQNGNTFTVTGLMPGEDVTIEVEAVGTGACGNSTATETCTAQNCPDVMITIDPVADICLDATAMPFDLSANATGGMGGGTETWDGPGITSMTDGTFDPTLAGPGTHTISYTYAEDNCTYNATITITIFALPTADFTVNSPICLDETTTIIYTGSAAPTATYTWNFNGGDAVPGTGAGPHEVSWLTEGEKTITLIVTENGCPSEVFTQTVQVDAPLDAPVINCNTSTTQIEFTWDDVVGATSYNVTVLTGQMGAQNGNTFTVTGLMPGEDVSIEVEAVGIGACGNSSTTETCTAQDCPDITIAIDAVPDICLTSIVVETDLNAMLTGASGNGTENWDGPGIIDPVNGTFDPNVSGPGAHTVNYTYTEDNCSYNASITITVFALPTADFTLTTPICVDESTLLTYLGSAAPDATYTWDFDGGTAVPGVGVGPHEISWSEAGTKTISLVVEENGCISEPFTATIEVEAPLEVPIIGCETTNTSITFSWEPIDGAVNYTVVDVTGPTGTLNGTSYTVDGLSPGDNVIIQVIAEGTGPCGNSMAEQSCIAQDCPSVTVTIAPLEVCVDGGPQTLTATAEGGTGGGTYEWAGPGIIDATTGTFDPAAVTPGPNTIALTYSEGVCQYTASIDVIVNPIPSADFTATGPICIDSESTVDYVGNADNSATFDWNFDDGVANPGVGPGPHTVSWTTAGTKTISLTVTENGCTSEVFTQTVEVEPILEAPIITCITTDNSITFTWNMVDGATDYQIVDVSGPTGTLTGTTEYSITGLNPNQEVTIQVIAIGTTICGNSMAEATCVAQDCPPLTASITGTEAICEGDQAELSFNFDSNSPGPFTVTYTTNGIVEMVTVQNGETIQVNPSETSTYTLVSIEDNTFMDCAYPATDTWTITVNEPIELVLAGDPSQVCAGTDTLLNLVDLLSSNPGGTWSEVSQSPSSGNAFNANLGTFNPANQTAGVYDFAYTIDAPDPCPDPQTVVSVVLQDAPVADAGDNQALSCNMGMVSLGGSETTPGMNYTWTSTDPNIIISNPNAQFIETSQPGTYILTVENELGCSSTDEVEVDAAFDVPVAQVSISDISCFQADDGAIFLENITGGNGPYEISLNGTPFSNQTFFPSLSPGEYSLVIRDQSGCSSELMVDLTQPQEVLVNLVAILDNDNIIQLGDSVNLVAQFDPSIRVDTIMWEPDTISSGSSASIWVQPGATTSYEVMVVDENGCADDDRITIIVEKTRPVYIPNAFSPNNDNINDIFMIQAGDSIKEVKAFAVFNRWGEPMIELFNFQPNDPSFGWDGTHRGEVMNPAVFAYFAEIEFDDGEIIIYEGDVILMK